MTPDLPVPDEAVRRIDGLIEADPSREDDGRIDRDVARAWAGAISAPVVAAVLREEADASDADAASCLEKGLEATAEFHAGYARYFRERADEWHPGVSDGR